MPSYAPYGNAIFGLTAYGTPPVPHVQTTMSVSPIPTSGNPNSALYNSLFVQWVLPGGNWNELVLVRSSYGVPTSPFDNDGQDLLVNQVQISSGSTVYDNSAIYDIGLFYDGSSVAISGFGTSYTDTNLKSGRFYYYALFVFDTDINEWIQAASAQGLCLTDFQFPQFFKSWTPDWYMEQDLLQVPASPLGRFFDMIGFEMNWVRSEIESLYTLNSSEYISGAMLPFLGGNVGVPYEPALGMGLTRSLVSQAVNLYKIKGTSEGVQAAASAYTGYGCILTHGPNLEIQLDDATGDESVGHWLPYSNGTEIGTVSFATNFVVPQHTAYQPIQGNVGLSTGLIQQSGAKGYLPVSQENMITLSANSAYDWTQQLQNAVVPPTLREFAMAYNPNTGQTVIFGGNDGTNFHNDTWIFNGTYWRKASPATKPSARVQTRMAFDAITGNLILFGGIAGSSTANGQVADTWSWNGTNWSQLHPAHSPLARSGHMMATNGTDGVLLFGGYEDYFGQASFNDTWVWNGVDWLQQAPAVSPSVRAFSAVAYNSFQQATPNVGDGTVLLFGGINVGAAGAPALNDTWQWTASTWINKTPVHSPPGRVSGRMAFDIANDQLVLFGGNNAAGTAWFSDTWVWTGNDWKQPVITSGPLARASGGFEATAKNQLVLYGGYGNQTFGDTWIWNGTGWLQTEGTQTPLPRAGAMMAVNGGTVLMFGGFGPNNWTPTDNTNTGVIGSTWTWDSVNGWVEQLVPNAPSARGIGALVGITSTPGEFILFGGYNSTGLHNDTWQFSGGAWTNKNPISPPANRGNTAMVYDPTTAVCVLFGGQNVPGPGTQLNDTWHYDPVGNTWTQIHPPASPSIRRNHVFTYTTGTLSYMFGGDNDQANNIEIQYGDLWVYDSSGQTWTPVITTITPPGRSYATMVYDSSAQSLFLLYGENVVTGQRLTDTWQFFQGEWLSQAIPPDLAPRLQSMAAYYANTNQILFFGGQGASASVHLGDTWLANLVPAGVYISECDTTTSTVLGIPVPDTAQEITLSGYFQPTSAATPIIQQFYAQIDWYGQTGNLISSSVGTPITEIAGSWVRASVTDVPPAGAEYFGRTFKSVSQAFVGDTHLFDAVQTEVGTTATPGPSAWTPPRDLWLNLFPTSRNLIVNGQGLAGTYGWDAGGTGTGIAAVTVAPVGGWVQNVEAGFVITPFLSGGLHKFTMETNFSAATALPVNPGQAYSLSVWVQSNFGGDVSDFFTTTIKWYSTTNPASLISSTVGQNTSLVANTWVQNTQVDVIAPPNAQFAQVVITGQSDDVNTPYVAAPIFSPGLNTVYFDGNFSPSPDYSFEGTPNKSISAWYPNVLTRLSRLLTIMPEFIPIGSTYSIYTHALAWANAGLH